MKFALSITIYYIDMHGGTKASFIQQLTFLNTISGKRGVTLIKDRHLSQLLSYNWIVDEWKLSIGSRQIATRWD